MTVNTPMFTNSTIGIRTTQPRERTEHSGFGSI